jgi:hypothetical protein
VRQDPNADTCYALYTNYRELPGGHVSGSGVSYGYLQQEVVRINRGAVTSLAVFYAPGWSWADDWWFGALEVWGQNPVKLRVINKAPTVFVLGSDNAGTTPQGIGQAPAECFYLIDGVQYDSEIDWRENYPDGPRALNGCDAFSSPPSSGAVAWDAPGAHLSAGRAWIVWEGQDASADRILSGQPGIRWGGDNYFAAAKFSAGEITDRLTASVISGGGSSVVIGGYRQAGNTVTVT